MHVYSSSLYIWSGGQNSAELSLHVTGKLHLHEDPAARKTDQQAGEPDHLEHDAIHLGHSRFVSLVQNDEAHTSWNQ